MLCFLRVNSFPKYKFTSGSNLNQIIKHDEAWLNRFEYMCHFSMNTTCKQPLIKYRGIVYDAGS